MLEIHFNKLQIEKYLRPEIVLCLLLPSFRRTKDSKYQTHFILMPLKLIW